MIIDSRIDLELANREDELSEDKLKAVTGGWPGAWMGPHDNNYTPHGGGFQNETYDTSITFGWGH
jgi:hypothetical protein